MLTPLADTTLIGIGQANNHEYRTHVALYACRYAAIAFAADARRLFR